MARVERPAVTTATVPDTIQVVGNIRFNLLSEDEVIRHILSESSAGRGGWVVTPNIDICRRVSHDPEISALVRGATLIVPDGMPLIWAAKISGRPLAERVTGSSLIFTLTEAAAQTGLSIYLIGGGPGVPETAGENLARRYPGLKVAGTDASQIDFDKFAENVVAIRERLHAAAPDIIYVGLGFPKQERLISEFAPMLPAAWFIGCGAAIPFAAGSVPRAPVWMQRSGLEWTHRLLKEPRRLFRRYLVHDLPFAARLMITAAVQRAKAG
jgi:N-acetylglucosaminyldiphosphoundecaprenol N-acetyl-beta-D-mannosaminyltransferase